MSIHISVLFINTTLSVFVFNLIEIKSYVASEAFNIMPKEGSCVLGSRQRKWTAGARPTVPRSHHHPNTHRRICGWITYTFFIWHRFKVITHTPTICQNNVKTLHSQKVLSSESLDGLTERLGNFKASSLAIIPSAFLFLFQMRPQVSHVCGHVSENAYTSHSLTLHAAARKLTGLLLGMHVWELQLSTGNRE